MSEDCLYLNVWTPRLTPGRGLAGAGQEDRTEDGTGPTAGQPPWPVIVFIHGGRFADGFAGGLDSGLIYEGTSLVNGSVIGPDTGSTGPGTGKGQDGPSGNLTSGASAARLVLVTINYRLGIPGFLFTGEGGNSSSSTTSDSHDTARAKAGPGSLAGNYGLQDQAMALQWVQNNIAAFGGDPSRVTIMGQSAGAISVAMHLTRPDGGAGRLFHRAILHSEPFSLPLRDPQTGLDLAKSFAGHANCSPPGHGDDWRQALTRPPGPTSVPGPDDPWPQVEACMRNLSSKQLLDAQVAVETDIRTDVKHPMQLFTPFTPTIGTAYLPQGPLRAFLTGQAADVPIVMGFTRNESVLFVYGFFKRPVTDLEFYVAVGLLYGVETVEPLASHYLGPWKDSAGAVQGQELVDREGQDGLEKYRYIIGRQPLPAPASAVVRQTALRQAQPVWQAHMPGQRSLAQAPSNQDTRPALSRLGSDSLFICSIRNATLGALQQPAPALGVSINELNSSTDAVPARAARKSPIFTYRYDHVMSFAATMWGKNFSQCADMPCHGADLAQIFHPDQPDLGTNYTPPEDGLSRAMQAYWAAFAATGDPNGARTSNGAAGTVPWPAYNATDRAVLVLDVDQARPMVATGPAPTPSALRQAVPGTVGTASGIRVEYNVSQADCDFWDREIGYDY